ncbi:SH3 domain-containing protein [Heliomarina baculiformis]|uniref:SH3 domain-containing protein n=1 Tax=Heliomarina baculiformis TaxID=2872036 RepID=UPI001EE262FA|nr:SH3 domain-containing protein [Heliomarina baculiformis]
MKNSFSAFRLVNFARIVAATLALCGPAKAQDSVPIEFPPGASGTTINGSIIGNEYIDYVLTARAGQTLVADLSVIGTNGNGTAMFNIVPAGQDYPAIYAGDNDDDNRAEVVLSESGEWAIRVYLMGNDRDTGKTVGYSIDVLIPPGGTDTGSAGASIAMGDMVVVSGLQGTDLLNVRAGPGTGNSVTGQLANGDSVRRLGCQMSGSTEWCEIEMMTDMRERGWVAARYLGGSINESREPATSEERVRFAPGSSGAEYTDQLLPGASKRYVLGAQNGQSLYFRLLANGPLISYQIFNPDGTFLLEQTASSREYRGQFWQSGDHVIEVINRDNGAQSFNAIFSIQ